MMYERIEVTEDNLEWAIRENFYRIYRAIQTKVNYLENNEMNGFDAGDNSITQVPTPVDDSDAVNVATVQALLNI